MVANYQTYEILHFETSIISNSRTDMIADTFIRAQLPGGIAIQIHQNASRQIHEDRTKQIHQTIA